ncbi:MAG: hypothetical protein JO046_03560 [Solirubrobacterales bacterium]|nr:hypothetical protein [Solirubrobacterales bacterium]
MPIAFPAPGTAPATVAVAAPGSGFGAWAGAPSAALDSDLTFVIAYRVRSPQERGAEVVLARSGDGERLETVTRLDKSQFDAESLERPALVRTSEHRWRLYLSCATPGSKHWWIAVLEADDPGRLAGSEARIAFAGDEQTGVKDPVIRQGPGGWRAWICIHPLDEEGEEDRMSTAYATSEDGLQWRWHGTVFAGRPGMWDARGARVTSVLSEGRASYDGRASKEENFYERTGLACWDEVSGRLVALGTGPVSNAAYLEVVALPQGGYRLFYEAPLPGGSHELRTELVAPAGDAPIRAYTKPLV